MRLAFTGGLIAYGLTAIPAAAQDDAWRKEIDNSLVRVMRRLVGPHESVSTVEMPPALLVFLNDCSVRITTAGRQEERRGKPGGFLWHSGGRISLENLTDYPLEIAQVAPKFAPGSEGALSSPNNSQNIEFENDLIRVRRGRRAGGRRVFVHQGPPSVLIQLSAVRIKLTHPDGQVAEYRVKAGDIRFEPGGAFSIETETLGERLEALRIELRNGDRDR